MDITTVIIVKGGMVCDVYSTLPSVNHDIEVLDFDSDEQESPEENKRKDALMDEISNSDKFHAVY